MIDSKPDAVQKQSLRHIVVMGVTATGKTTIGLSLAEALSGVFVEGDAFHPQVNIEKMSAGIPLNDEDRRPWLIALAREIDRFDDVGETAVIACSALRRMYRDTLRAGQSDLFFVHLDLTFDVLLGRMKRRNHFMPPSLLRSQFDTLEPLEPDELGVVIDATHSVADVVAESLTAIKANNM